MKRSTETASRVSFASRSAALAILCASACGTVDGDVIVRVDAMADGAHVECLAARDCPSASKPKCNTALHVCAECILDSDCSDPRETCSTALHRCAAPCRSDADCRSDDPLCDLAIGYCVGCRAVTDCTDPQRPYCAEGDCVACPNGQC